jgi:type I restriction enzyme, S subunit
MALCDELEHKQNERNTLRLAFNDSALTHLVEAKEPNEFATHWNRLKNNFDMLYNTPETVGKLRQTILQLAVQGKLVAQDPKDEPASVLLGDIANEQERLIAEKKLKKTDQQEIRPDGSLYELPKGWEWCRLIDVGNTLTGTTPLTHKAEYYGSDYPFVKPGDITDKIIYYRKEGITKAGLIESGILVPSDSVLMVSIGGSIGKVGLVDRDCSCNQQINFIIPYKKICSRYLYWMMKSPIFQKKVIENASQTTLPIINKGKWERIEIPLPPSAEQHRIVAKVDELMALCDQMEKHLTLVDDIKSALLSSSISILGEK